MIARNALGKIEPYMMRGNRKFFAHKNNWTGKYEILEETPYMITEIRIGLWCPVDPFDSMVLAYKFLKENINEIM